MTGITLFGGPIAAPLLHLPSLPALHFEYGYPGCTVEVVGGVEEAIDYIHRHGRWGGGGMVLSGNSRNLMGGNDFYHLHFE